MVAALKCLPRAVIHRGPPAVLLEVTPSRPIGKQGVVRFRYRITGGIFAFVEPGPVDLALPAGEFDTDLFRSIPKQLVVRGAWGWRILPLRIEATIDGPPRRDISAASSLKFASVKAARLAAPAVRFSDALEAGTRVNGTWMNASRDQRSRLTSSLAVELERTRSGFLRRWNSEK